MYLCLPWASPGEYLHKPPSLSWPEDLILSLALGCFPWSAGRRAGSFMRCQGDRSTWPTLCCVRVSPETTDALCRQFRRFVREQTSEDSCQLCSSARRAALWCETGCAGLAYTELGLWSVRSQGVVRTQHHESDTAHDLNVYSLWGSVQLCKKEVWLMHYETQRVYLPWWPSFEWEDFFFS